MLTHTIHIEHILLILHILNFCTIFFSIFAEFGEFATCQCVCSMYTSDFKTDHRITHNTHCHHYSSLPSISIALPSAVFATVHTMYVYQHNGKQSMIRGRQATVDRCFGNGVDRRLIVLRSKRARAQLFCLFHIYVYKNLLLLLLFEATNRLCCIHNFCRLAIPVSSVDLLLWSIKDACININIHSILLLSTF